MIIRKTFILSLFFIFSLFFLSSCIKKDTDRKKELNEILTIARNFKHTKFIILGNSLSEYIITYDSLSVNKKPICIYCEETEFNKIMLEVENIESMSSKLYLTKFVQGIYYKKEEGLLRVWFYKFPYIDKKGIEWKNEKWREFIIKNDKLIYL